MINTKKFSFSSPLGHLELRVRGGALVGLQRVLPPALGPPSAAEPTTGPSWAQPYITALLEYASQGIPLPDLPVQPQSGTAFQRKVWAHLQTLPFGARATYGEVAAALGIPGAARAVGSACGANPVLLWIPCHRVVAAQGLGGFSAGLDLKRYLLDIESPR